ncbi:Uncharacterised protein [Chlamydia trachomatis]|nr:Uncharacterised protein [Chlamydia trachomatis]
MVIAFFRPSSAGENFNFRNSSAICKKIITINSCFQSFEYSIIFSKKII